MAGQGHIVWRCRRGMKELDVLLERYLRSSFESATAAQAEAFEKLLDLQDPQLYELLLGRERAMDRTTQDVIETIRITPDR